MKFWGMFLIPYLISCANTEIKGEESLVKDEVSKNEEMILTILEKSVFPIKFDSQKFDSVYKKAKILNKMLDFGVVSRPKVELREGPGVKFNIQNDFLEQSTSVLIFDRIDQWVKVFDYSKSLKIGWIHEKTLEAVNLHVGDTIVDFKKLPTVTTLNNIQKVFTYPDQKPESVNIAKGRQFIILKKMDGKGLVLIFETNSIMWLSLKEVG